MRLKYLAKHIDERLVTPEMELMSVSKTKGVIPRSEISDADGRAEDISHYKTCQPGDLVINRMSAYQGALGIAKQVGAVSPDYMVLRFGPKIAPEFGGYFFKSHQTISLMSSLVKGIGSVDSGSVRTPRLSWTDLGNSPVSIPTLEEQIAIAEFLDSETAQIDELIGKQQQLVETLAERRKAVITRAVTRGLDAKVPFKDSKVEWLGPVPAHWEIKRLKEANLFIKGGVWGEEPSGDGFDIWCVRMADFDRNKQTISLDKKTYRNVKPSERINRVLKFGDLILEKSGGGDASPVGAVMHFEHEEPAVCSNFACILRIKPDQDSKFWTYVHHAIYANRLTWRSIKQTSGIQNLDTDSYFNERIGFPPLNEQRNIVAFLENAMMEIDTLIDKAISTIELLQERRQALISAAVTGKIDIRGK